MTITPLLGLLTSVVLCRMKGATSAWAPYLNILPPYSPLPLSLPPHLWEEVQWPAMERQLSGMREEIENAYAAVVHPQFGLEDFGECPAPASNPQPPTWSGPVDLFPFPVQFGRCPWCTAARSPWGGGRW